MRDEVAAAVVLISRIVKKNENLSEEKVEQFSDQLTKVLVERFRNHWYAEKPHKGQAYRCIRVNANERGDPVLVQAATDSGLQYSELGLPGEFTLWVDPQEVTCRFSEVKGHCYTVANFKDGKSENKALTLNIDDMMEDQVNFNEGSFKAQRINTPSNQTLDNSQFYLNTTFSLQDYFHSDGYYGGFNATYTDQSFHGGNYPDMGIPNQGIPNHFDQGSSNYPTYKHSHHPRKMPKKHAGHGKADRFHWARAGNLAKA